MSSGVASRFDHCCSGGGAAPAQAASRPSRAAVSACRMRPPEAVQPCPAAAALSTQPLDGPPGCGEISRLMIRVQREDFDPGQELTRLLAGRRDIGGAVTFVGLVR